MKSIPAFRVSTRPSRQSAQGLSRREFIRQAGKTAIASAVASAPYIWIPKAYAIPGDVYISATNPGTTPWYQTITEMLSDLGTQPATQVNSHFFGDQEYGAPPIDSPLRDYLGFFTI